MLWIKRNLFLTVGGVVAIALLALGIYYALNAISEKAKLSEELKENESTLNRLYQQDPFPATTNVDAAKRETERLRSALGRMEKFFSAPPVERVTGLAFRTYRDNLLAELRKAASAASTTVPSPTYAFSFEEQRTRVDFDPRTFPLIPEQMADVKAICDVLFAAHVSPLINIRRARVSGDDEKSSNQSDYNFLQLMTNVANGAIISPYEVCFQGLSAELASVVQKLAVSPYGMVLKAVQIDPLEAQGAPAPGGPTTTPQNRQRFTPANPAPKPSSPDKGVSLLNERRFNVSMLIYVVRAVPGGGTGVLPATPLGTPGPKRPRIRPPAAPAPAPN